MTNKNSVAAFEKNLAELETLVEKLEQGELSLDDSLKQFERGIKLARDCQQSLSKAEQRIQIMLKNTSELSDFSPDVDAE